MTQHFGQAGKSTRDMEYQRRAAGFTIFRLGMLVFISTLIFVFLIREWRLAALIVYPLILIVWIYSKRSARRIEMLGDEMRRARRGAEAEETIGEILAALDSKNFHVYHDVVCPHGNVDHIVISRKKGVFLIETKAHGGRVELTDTAILIDGKPTEKDFIAQTLKNTYWLRDTIVGATGSKVWIKPVIVFTNAFVVRGKPIKNITVTNKKYLMSLIQEQVYRRENEVFWQSREKVVQAFGWKPE